MCDLTYSDASLQNRYVLSIIFRRNMKNIHKDEEKRLKALSKRLRDAELGENLRINLARILNRHFKETGYDVKNVINDEPSKGEQDGKPEQGHADRQIRTRPRDKKL